VRRLGYAALAASVAATVGAGVVEVTTPFGDLAVAGVLVGPAATKLLLVAAIVLGSYGVYRLLLGVLADHVASKRRIHDVRNVLRLLVGTLALVASLGVLTEQWVGVLFSLGIVGFAITFALQQPILSLLGWVYVMVNRPYAVGDRIAIGDYRGDVIAVDFLVTTVWEVDGDLVSTNQPSGRVVTVPNAVVLSSEVVNFSSVVERVWNELTVQVAYETDLAFATETMREAADDLLGEEMADHVAAYRRALDETPVALEVQDRPTVNVVQRESWVELRLRYLVHPRRGTRVRNELYRRILDRFDEAPDRVKFPVGRNR
jgi:small-conductance mechanosensitive channel